MAKQTFDPTVLFFNVELRKTRPTFRNFIGPYIDLSEARRVAAVGGLQRGNETGVVDRHQEHGSPWGIIAPVIEALLRLRMHTQHAHETQSDQYVAEVHTPKRLCGAKPRGDSLARTVRQGLATR